MANKAVCELLGLKSGAATSDVTAKIMELKGGIVDGVNLREKVEKLEKAAAQRDADEAVTQALKAGKITPAQKKWAVSYALSDPKGLRGLRGKGPAGGPHGPDHPGWPGYAQRAAWTRRPASCASSWASTKKTSRSTE